MTEEWKAIKGYEGSFEISNHGNVRSLDRTIERRRYGKIFVKGQMMKQQTARNGYQFVYLTRDGSKKIGSVHRLVAQHFIEPVEGCPEVNHKDRDKKNNHVDNLEWSNSKLNSQHAVMTGYHRVKLTPEDVRKIRVLNEAFTQKEIAKMFGVSTPTINHIITGRTWSYLK